MRERLIEMLEHCPSINWLDDSRLEIIADYMLNHGVIVPPVKVGQSVWYIRHKDVLETCVEKIILKNGGLYIKLWCNSSYETTCRSIGETVFLTKEEAERALAERSKK